MNWFEEQGWSGVGDCQSRASRGYSVSYCITSVPYGDVLFTCRDVTRFLQLLLRREGYVFKTSSEFEIVRQIKEVKEC